ncbi:MAG: FUSC family protein [Stellaceae bacterium]
MGHVLARTALVAGGGALQLLCYTALLGLERGRRPRPSLRRILADAAIAVSGLRFHLRLSSPRFQFAVRFALVLLAATAIERSLVLPNGYWIAMTALILMRPDFQDTLARGLGRVGGTILGALGATIFTHFYTPSAQALAALVAFFATASFVSVRANYGLFALFITTYVLFLLVLAGLAEEQVALSRALATALGAGLALLAHLDFFRLRRQARLP